MRKRSLPQHVQKALKAISDERVVVAAVRTVSNTDSVTLQRLNLCSANSGVNAGASAPPARNVGLFARRNLDGWQERRMDLAKVHREIGHWAPSWHGSGTHYVSRSIEAYPVDNHPARLLTITTTVLEQLDGAFVVRLRVDQPLLRTAPDFVEDLKFNLALLREFCGLANIYSADMTDGEYARIQQVDWELLPPGSLPRMIERINFKSAANPQQVEVAVERLRILDRLKPDGFIQGAGKFSSYFGAKFGPRLVALENLEYGNAMYVFEDEWERLSQVSRTELVKRRDDNVHRIPHTAGWGSAIRKLVRDTSKSDTV